MQEALERPGHSTTVLAPQRQQAIDLAKDGLGNTQTVAEFLAARSVPERAVVVIDEAGQIGARQMLDLLKLVEAHGGRVILSGDTRQHGPVEASDALRAIERYSGLRAAELNEIRRQDPTRAREQSERARIAEYREAVKEASQGALEASFDRLEQLGAIREAGLDSLRDELAAAYVDLVQKKESCLSGWVTKASQEGRKAGKCAASPATSCFPAFLRACFQRCGTQSDKQGRNQPSWCHRPGRKTTS